MNKESIENILKGCGNNGVDLGQGGVGQCGTKYHPDNKNLMYCKSCEAKIDLLIEMGLIESKEIDIYNTKIYSSKDYGIFNIRALKFENINNTNNP